MEISWEPGKKTKFFFIANQVDKIKLNLILSTASFCVFHT